MVECLTRNWGVASKSLTGGTALCTWARQFIPCLVLAQPKKTPPNMTEKMLTGIYTYQHKQTKIFTIYPTKQETCTVNSFRKAVNVKQIFLHHFVNILSENKFEQVHEISNNMVCATSKGSDQPAHTRSLVWAFASRLSNLWVLSYWPNTIWSF